MNDVPMHLLRGNAAPTAAQLVSADASVRWSLSKNPFLRGDGTNPVIMDDGGHVGRVRAIICDGRGQPLVQPVEISANFIATPTASVGTLAMTRTGTNFTTAVVTPSASGAVDVTFNFGEARAGAVFFIRHPYSALPVTPVLIT